MKEVITGKQLSSKISVSELFEHSSAYLGGRDSPNRLRGMSIRRQNVRRIPESLYVNI